MIIRTETPKDFEAISQITFAAFNGKFHSGPPNEHLIILELRKAGALSLSLVAELDGQAVGHVAFSIVTIDGEDKGWFGLGPISVKPEFQKQGIGSKLINEGLSRIRAMRAKGCVLEGDPNYYHRFGFKSYPGFYYAGAPSAEYFMALPFYDDAPEGKVEFHPAFYTNV